MESEKALRLIASVLTQERFESAATAIAPGLATIARAREAGVGFDDNGHAALAVKARGRGVTLKCNADRALPATIHCDPTCLRRNVASLVGNTVRFTGNRDVCFTLRLITSNVKPHISASGAIAEIAPMPTPLPRVAERLVVPDDTNEPEKMVRV